MLVLGGCIHNEGYLKGVALQPEPVLGPVIARTTASAIWAQSRRYPKLWMQPPKTNTVQGHTYKVQPPLVGPFPYSAMLFGHDCQTTWQNMEMDTEQFRNLQESERYDIYLSGSNKKITRENGKGTLM